MNASLPGKPFSMAADLIGDATRDMKLAADALANEPLTVPSAISRAARKAHRDLERLRNTVETMRLSGPVVLCGDCGRRLRLVAHDAQRETWTAECWACEVRSTLSASG